MPLPTIITSNIGLDSPSVSIPSLGRIMILGFNGPAAVPEGTSKIYTSAADMLTDGYVAGNFEYDAAASIFSQGLRPADVRVGHMAAYVAQVSRFEITGSDDGTYEITITMKSGSAATVTYTASGDTDTQVRDGLEALILADADFNSWVSVVDAPDDSLDLTSKTPGASFTLAKGGSHQTDIVLTVQTPNTGPQEHLATQYAASTDFYGLVSESVQDDLVNEIATWSEAQAPKRMYFAQGNAAGILSGAAENVQIELKLRSLESVSHLYYATDSTPAAAAWLGKFLATDPDSGVTTAAFKTLTGVTVSTLTSAQMSTVEGSAQNGNYYGSLGGIGATFPGKTSSGHYLDVILTRAWFETRVTAALQNLLLAYSNLGKKIPYTDAGIEIIANEIRKYLHLGTSLGHFAPDPPFTMTIPKRTDVASADVTARLLRITWSATPSGAIHSVVMTGSISTTI